MATQPTGWWSLRREIIRASEHHSPVDFATLVNAVLDAIPRVEIRWSGRPQPAFRTCGTVGFSVAVVVAVSGALLGHRSMLALTEATGVAVISFFAWALLRRAITGVERLVLLEHVWIALLSVAAVLKLQGLPVGATLDPFCAGLAFFLAGGRAGCLMVGCCHGHPSAVGIRYPAAHAKDGFAAHLTDIRLFPVQLLEFLGLLLIGVTTFLMVPLAEPGRATVWYLFSYALLRFCLEELRGDERPHWFDMSVPRWMCLGEFAFTLALLQPSGWLPMLTVASGLALYLGRDTDRQLLKRNHVQELQALLEGFRKLEETPSGLLAWSTSRGVTLAISTSGTGNSGILHLSLCLPARKESLELACRLAVAAFPRLDPSSGIYGGSNTLHFSLTPNSNSHVDFRQMYRHVLVRLESTALVVQAAAAPPQIPWYWRPSNGRGQQ